jgi:hypothetical protein
LYNLDAVARIVIRVSKYGDVFDKQPSYQLPVEHGNPSKFMAQPTEERL